MGNLMAEKNQYSCTHLFAHATHLLHTQESSSIYKRDRSYSWISPLHIHILSTQKTVSQKYLIFFYIYMSYDMQTLIAHAKAK